MDARLIPCARDMVVRAGDRLLVVAGICVGTYTGTAPTGTAPTGTAPTGTAPTGTAPTGTAPTGTAPTGPAPANGAGRPVRPEAGAGAGAAAPKRPVGRPRGHKRPKNLPATESPAVAAHRARVVDALRSLGGAAGAPQLRAALGGVPAADNYKHAAALHLLRAGGALRVSGSTGRNLVYTLVDGAAGGAGEGAAGGAAAGP